MTDYKALIAEARDWSDWTKEGKLLHDLADVLEAATVAPAVDREALVEWFKWHADPNDVADALLASGILRDVRDMPAVDREALAKVLEADECYERDANSARWVFHPRLGADALLASGVLRDVRDVQAEALSGAALNIVAGAGLIPPPNGRHPAEAWLHDRAQAIREARSER